MSIRTQRTVFLIIGIFMLIYIGGLAERLSFWHYLVLQSIDAFFLFYGAYLWTKLKNRHWAWIFTMIFWPVGLLVLSMLKESGTKDDDQAIQPGTDLGGTIQRPSEDKLKGGGQFSGDYQQLALRAEQLNIRGDYRGVVELLEPYTGNPDNKNTSFFNELGIAYGKIGSQLQDTAFWHKAYDCHKNAYRLDSNEPIYMFNLAMAATWIENYEKAQELLIKYLESGHRKELQLAKNVLKKLKAMQGNGISP